MRPDDGALQLVKEFYANLEEKVVDKVIVRGKWISMFSEAINKLIGGKACLWKQSTN